MCLSVLGYFWWQALRFKTLLLVGKMCTRILDSGGQSLQGSWLSQVSLLLSEPGYTLSRQRIDIIGDSATSLRPPKIVCVGRNYPDHAVALGSVVPAEPLIFLKPSSSVIDSGMPIIVPSGVGRVDYEGEIGIRIGVSSRHVSELEAWDIVDGIL